MNEHLTPNNPFHSENDAPGSVPDNRPIPIDDGERAPHEPGETEAVLGVVALNPGGQQPTVTVRTLNMIHQQAEAERTYTMDVHPVAGDVELSDEAIVQRFELEHTVRIAPRLSEQLADTSRNNPVSYLVDQQRSVKTYTSNAEFSQHRKEAPEFEALQGLEALLQEAVASDPAAAEPYARDAKSLLENLTFIGEREYTEASQGIALYWKHVLDTNPEQRLFVLAGEIKKQGKRQVKSDEYLLDRVLEHFSDEELKTYGDRLTSNKNKLTDDVDNTRIIALDDWTISGSQIKTALEDFTDAQKARYGRDFTRQVEAQLIVASQYRIKHGTVDRAADFSPRSLTSMIPVRAYFMAHDAEEDRRTEVHTGNEAHITGAHSSVDFGFEMQIEEIIEALNHKDGGTRTMPPLTNVIRPFRSEEGYVLTETQRMKKIAARAADRARRLAKKQIR